MFEETSDDEVDNGEGEGGNYETDDGVKNGLFGFFDFGGITGGSHVIDAAYYNKDGGDDAEDVDDGIDDADDGVRKIVGSVAVASVGLFDFSRDVVLTADIIGCSGMDRRWSERCETDER